MFAVAWVKTDQALESLMAKKSSQHLAARCSDELAQKIMLWCKENHMSQSQLIVRAVEKYISEDQTLKAVALSDHEAEQLGAEVIKKHAYTLEKLK
jgi:hypothetical protein